MDPITHGLTGALVGKGFFADRYGRTATVAVTLGALFPDSDVFFNLFAPNPLATLEWHRGLTHSFLALPAFAALLAGLSRYLLHRRRGGGPKFSTLWALYALGLAIHILLDLMTSFGTIIWSPLASTRVSWDLVFIIDLTFTAIVLLPQVVAWIYRERAEAVRRGVLAWLFLSVFAVAVVQVVTPRLEVAFPTGVMLVVSGLVATLFLLPAVKGWGFVQPPNLRGRLFCRIGVAALAGYLALCATNHLLALRRVEAFATRAHLKVKTLAALPAPLSPFRWAGLILTPQGVYDSRFSLLDPYPPNPAQRDRAGAPEFAFFANAPPNRYIEIAEDLPEVKTYRWFARFAVVSYHSQGELHMVDYTDLRFSGGRRRRPAGFVFRVRLNAAGEVLSVGFLGS